MLLRTARLTLEVSGRSRRTEVIYWWFATGLIGVVLTFALSIALPWTASVIAGEIVDVIFSIPMFALFARRLHDQNRSGLWSLLFPLSIALSLPDTVRWVVDDPDQLIAYQQAGPHPVQWLAGIASIALLVFLLLPGTVGPNRFGVDPREGNTD